jgi:hypothetical protein
MVLCHQYLFDIVALYMEEHNRSLKVAVQGLDFMAHPLYIHTWKKTKSDTSMQQDAEI